MEYLVVMGIGAFGYTLLELLWRGHTHWTMAIAGSVCFLLIYLVHTKMSGMSLWLRGLLCALLVTMVELLIGVVVNLKLHWAVWDYSGQPFNLYGQICILYSALWYFLAIPLAPVCRFLQRVWFR